MVPHHWAVLVGNILTTSAKLGTAAVSKGRTELFMSEVNKGPFNPRGLKVTLASTDAVMARCRMPQDAPLPLGEDGQSLQGRLLSTVAPYTAAITMDVPPPTNQRSTLDKLSTRQVVTDVKKTEKKREKEQEKSRKSSRKNTIVSTRN